ncbi:MAG: hypothetical protein JNJ57_03525 [Saprospiraceae bacterium]|nr:hypothetical protein [Saprospiraceae bacterium]
MKKSNIQIEVTIPSTLSLALERLPSVVEDQINTYVPQLLKGLQIEGVITTDVQIHTDPAEEWIELKINGLKARTRFYIGLKEEFTRVLPLGAAICDEIARNRILLAATPGVLAQARALAHESYAQFSEQDQQKIVQQLFHLGFGIERLKDAIADEAALKNWDSFVEKCIGDLDATQISMFACKQDLADDDNPNDFNRLVETLQWATEEIFITQGIPAPGIQKMEAPLQPGNYYFRFNDLILPARNFADVREGYQYLNTLLQSLGFFFINRESVEFLLSTLETDNPNLLRIFKEKYSTDYLVKVLRQLVYEKISIRGLVRILEIMVIVDDAYEVPPDTWFPTPSTENVSFSGPNALADHTLEQRIDGFRLYYKSGLRNLTLKFTSPTSPSMVRAAMALKVHDFCRDLQAAQKNGDEKAEAAVLKKFRQQIAYWAKDTIHRQMPWFLINTISSYRNLIQQAIYMEFPDVLVFTNQELVLLNLTPEQCYSFDLV